MVEGATPLDRDRALILALDRLPHTIDQALTKRAPNILCAFAFELAQSFSRFYAAHTGSRCAASRCANLKRCSICWELRCRRGCDQAPCSAFTHSAAGPAAATQSIAMATAPTITHSATNDTIQTSPLR
jgi:hypothetical protein